jgi:DNA polymerase-1
LLTLLIDADVLRYQLSFKNTKTVKWEDEDDGAEVVVAEVTNPEKAKADLDDYIEELLEKFGTRHFLLPLSVSTNFRKGILPTYKGNRTKPKPALWTAVDGFLHELYPEKIITREYLEGDDILGLLSTMPKPRLCPGKRVIVSIDKDMQTIPGRLFNPGKPDIGTRTITEHDANYFWMTQVLTGDTVDNYKGCPGIGPKKADEFLMPVHEALRSGPVEQHLLALWATVQMVYESKGFTAADASVQARCARILRDGDYNFKTEEVKLWNP